MGKYMIVRQGNQWIVKQGWSIVYMGESKAECLKWIEENG